MIDNWDNNGQKTLLSVPKGKANTFMPHQRRKDIAFQKSVTNCSAHTDNIMYRACLFK